MWPKLRVFAWASTLVLLGYSAGLLSRRYRDPQLEHDRAGARAYSARLREDARRRAGQGDYEGAFTRLDQARAASPVGEVHPEVDALRETLRAEVSQVNRPASSSPAASPPRPGQVP
jgi:hypothetical protein